MDKSNFNKASVMEENINYMLGFFFWLWKGVPIQSNHSGKHGLSWAVGFSYC